MYALKRYLFRLGHAARSGRYATSVEQLVVGVAPVMAWGPVPQGGRERARFVRAHRKSVQRWLDDLQAAGLVAHEPERDNRGQWWRTQIVLLASPEPRPEELRAASARASGWRRRERARRRCGRMAPSLAAIRGRSAVPGALVRRRTARVRAGAVHELRRRARVEVEIARAAGVRTESRVLTHPFGAPPASADAFWSLERDQSSGASVAEASTAVSSDETLEENARVVVETGARACAAAVGGTPAPAGKECIEEITRLSHEDFDALVLQRVAARQRQAAWRIHAIRRQARRRAAEVLVWPVGRSCPLGRLREAWAVFRYGPETVAEAGAAAAGAPRPELAQRARCVVELYEAFAEHRPPGWPVAGAAALCVLAAQRRADRLAGDVARLDGLARGMRAVAVQRNTARLASGRERAERRQGPPRGRFEFRIRRSGRRGWETAEQRRQRVRDLVLLAGDDPAGWPNAALAMRHHPALRAAAASQARLVERDRFEELDGVGARGRRYREQLAAGVWRFPPGLPNDRELNPQEVASE